MKKLYIYLLLLLIMGGCYTKSIIYNSQANIPYYNYSTKTSFTFIGAVKSYFGIISAIDNDTLSYILLAPVERPSLINKLSNINLNHSTPLLPQQAAQFCEILDSSISAWNIKFDSKKGIHYMFTIAPENMIIQQSANVIKWYPYLRFDFHNDNKPQATLILGDEYFKYIYQLNSIEMLTDLSKYIKDGLSKK